MTSHIESLPFTSRRSVLIAPHAVVSANQPLAADIGLGILKKGGNAADAAVATAAALALTEPCSTGLGGDAFALFYNAAEKKVHSVNGSGRSPSSLTLGKLESDGFTAARPLPAHHGHTVTVPGAAACWLDLLDKHGSGKLTLSEILDPAIKLAENGFPVSQITAYFWKEGSPHLKDRKNKYGGDMLIGGNAPKWGQVFKNPNLANTFKALTQEGKDGYYKGRIAEAIVEAVSEHGGSMTVDDLKNHQSTFEEAISVEYKGARLWEIPPNTQGIVALMALSMLKNIDVKTMGHNSPAYLHTLIESVRLAFKDGLTYIADPSKAQVPIKAMISDEQGLKRSKLISEERALDLGELKASSDLTTSSDTTYFSVVDSDGNACSFINSNYMGFGTGIVPKGCGFTLQNRGFNFSMEPGHPNVVAPNKRPYHTIIPAMITDDKTGDLLACYGVMGGFMQPQGHLQVMLNLRDFGMDPQAALDAPRFCVGPGHAGPVGAVSFEDGITEETVEELRKLGHEVDGPRKGHKRALFGRGHVITKGAWWASESSGIADDKTVLWSGADPRADGVSLGF